MTTCWKLCVAAMLFEKTQHLAERSSQHLYAIMSFSYVGAMLCSNYALQYISYPAQVSNCHIVVQCLRMVHMSRHKALISTNLIISSGTKGIVMEGVLLPFCQLLDNCCHSFHHDSFVAWRNDEVCWDQCSMLLSVLWLIVGSQKGRQVL